MLAALVLAVLPFLAVSNAQNCTRVATVEDGDTCDSISTKYGVSTFQLALVNDATVDEDCDNLAINQTLCLGISGEDCTKVYTVVANDTCDWIIQMYGMTNETLYANNPQIDSECYNIYIGEVLCVDTVAYSYPEYNSTLFSSVADTYIPYCDE